MADLEKFDISFFIDMARYSYSCMASIELCRSGLKLD